MILFTLIGFSNLFAQITNEQDSAKLNQPLQMAQDSLKKVSQITEPVKVKKDARPIGQRLSFGINTAFWSNRSNTYFEFSPLLTYHFPKTYSIGAGPAYVYNRDRVNNIGLHGWGGKVYGRADFNRWIYGWTEYQGISNQYYKGIIINKPEKANTYIDSWFLSLGLHVPLGRSSFNMQVLYDVLYDKKKSYTYGPVTYRIGFGF